MSRFISYDLGQLWSRGNIVASRLAGLGSIPGEVFSLFYLNSNMHLHGKSGLNARSDIADVVTKILRGYGWEVLPHASCSPDMSSADFDLFLKLKETMRG